MKNFSKPLPTNVTSSIDTFADDINKIVEALAEIRASVPADSTDIGSVSASAYSAVANRVTALETAISQLENVAVVTVPSAPTITNIVASDSQVSVSFTPPASNGGSTITKYVATTSTGKVVEGTSSPIVITGLTNGASLTVTLKAVNSVGSSVDSAASASVTPISLAKPTAPTSVTIQPGNAIAVLNWSVPTSDGGSAIIGYRVTRNGAISTDLASTARTFTATGLINGSAYTFTIAAINANGTGPVATISTTPVAVDYEARKYELLGVSTGFASKMPFNSGVNPAGRGGRFGSPDGYEWLNDVIETQRGVPFDIRTGYQYNNRNVSEGSTAWNDLIGMQVLDWFDSKFPAVLGMPMFPTGGTYAAAAAGSYDSQYIAIGQTIKSKRPAGTGKVVLRLDWEFNYGTRASQNLTNWNNAWRRAVTKIREGAGDRVKFSWSIAANTSSLTTLKGMYPGNDYVDVVGIDTYDAFINAGQGYHNEADWLQWTGIGEVFAWAKSNDKLVGLDEWGGHNNNPSTNHSGGDNPDFPNIVLEWCRKNAESVAYELSFNDTAAGNVLNNLWNYNSIAVQLPNQRAAYIDKVRSLAVGATNATQRAALVKGVDKPNVSNTGIYTDTAMTIVTSHTPVSNTTYRDLDIRDIFTFNNVSNVTYINCIFRGETVVPTTATSLVRAFNVHGGGHKFIDCTFKPQAPHYQISGIMGYGFSLTRCQFSDVTDSVSIYNNNNGPAGSGDNSLRNGPVNVTIEQSYFYDNGWWPESLDAGGGAIGSHSDQIQYQSGSNVNIIGNNFTGMIGRKYGPNSYGTYQTNAALLIKPDVGLISGLTVTSNWIDGGSFSINIANDAPDRYLSNLGTISNNKFGRNQRIQGSTADASFTISMPSNVTGTFTGNVYEDNGNAITVRRNG